MKINDNKYLFLFPLAMIFVGIYYYDLNNLFFGIVIAFFTLLTCIGGYRSIEVKQNVVVIRFERMLPFLSTEKVIPYNDIEDIDYHEKRTGCLLFYLSILYYLAQNLPFLFFLDDEVFIELKNGEVLKQQQVSTKKHFKEAVDLMKKRVEANNRKLDLSRRDCSKKCVNVIFVN